MLDWRFALGCQGRGGFLDGGIAKAGALCDATFLVGRAVISFI